MTNEQVLNEIALNRRKVSHPVWGSFIIQRPTNRILSLMETERTRSLNRDLQEKEKVRDPMSGEAKLVPAFLTRKAKAKILEDIGEWTKEDARLTEEAEERYRNVCVRMESAGFEGVDELLKSYGDCLETIRDLIPEEDLKRLEAPLAAAFPLDEDILNLDEKKYDAAKRKILKEVKSREVSNLFKEVDRFHKQYVLLRDGIQAQTDLYTMKLREVTLFSDTVEARADRATHMIKIAHCVLGENTEERLWDSVIDVEDEPADKLRWLLNEVEKFERVDNNNIDSTAKVGKYDFLSLLSAPNESYEDAPDPQLSNPDGEPSEKTESDSSEASDTEKKN